MADSEYGWCGECGLPWEACDCSPNGFYDPDEESDPEYACIKCGENSSDQCQACGAPLCHMHFELGAGFCGRCDIEKGMREQGY